jgi:lysozyme
MQWIINFILSLFTPKKPLESGEITPINVPQEPSIPVITRKGEMRNINEAGLQLIKHFEGLYLKPYADPVGIPTIGLGTIAYENGQKVKLSDPPITEKRALELLDFELNEKELIIDTFLKKRKLLISENQFSAIVSICYNCGTGILTDSGRSFHQAILSQNPAKIEAAFMMYNKGTKKVLGISRKVELPGLTRRRKAEVKLYFS